MTLSPEFEARRAALRQSTWINGVGQTYAKFEGGVVMAIINTMGAHALEACLWGVDLEDAWLGCAVIERRTFWGDDGKQRFVVGTLVYPNDPGRKHQALFGAPTLVHKAAFDWFDAHG